MKKLAKAKQVEDDAFGLHFEQPFAKHLLSGTNSAPLRVQFKPLSRQMTKLYLAITTYSPTITHHCRVLERNGNLVGKFARRQATIFRQTIAIRLAYLTRQWREHSPVLRRTGSGAQKLQILLFQQHALVQGLSLSLSLPDKTFLTSLVNRTIGDADLCPIMGEVAKGAHRILQHWSMTTVQHHNMATSLILPRSSLSSKPILRMENKQIIKIPPPQNVANGSNQNASSKVVSFANFKQFSWPL